MAVTLKPDHTKALLSLAPEDSPLKVALGDVRDAPDSHIAAPMELSDASLWDYYFSARLLDEVIVRPTCGPFNAQNAVTLGGLLDRYLAVDGTCLLFLTDEQLESSSLIETLQASFEGVGFTIQQKEPGKLVLQRKQYTD